MFHFVFQYKNIIHLNHNIIFSTPHFPSAPFRLLMPSIRHQFSHPQPYPAALFALCPTPIQTVPTIGKVRCRFAMGSLSLRSSRPPLRPFNRP